MAKEIKYGSEARTALEKGVNQLADKVKEMSFLTNLSERRLLQTMV